MKPGYRQLPCQCRPGCTAKVMIGEAPSTDERRRVEALSKLRVIERYVREVKAVLKPKVIKVPKVKEDSCAPGQVGHVAG